MNSLKQYCLTLELHDDKDLINAYEDLHKPGNVWPEVVESIYAAGILEMTIFRQQNQLIMIIQTDVSFDFAEKAKSDQENPRVMEWEELTSKFQKLGELGSQAGKWRLAGPIFLLSEHRRQHAAGGVKITAAHE